MGGREMWNEFRDIIDEYQSTLAKLGVRIDIYTQENDDMLLSTFRLNNKWWSISVSKSVGDLVHASIEEYDLNKSEPPRARGMFHKKSVVLPFFIEALSDVFSPIIARYISDYLRRRYKFKVNFRRQDPPYTFWINGSFYMTIKLKRENLYICLQDGESGRKYYEGNLPIGEGDFLIDGVAQAIVLFIGL